MEEFLLLSSLNVLFIHFPLLNRALLKAPPELQPHFNLYFLTSSLKTQGEPKAEDFGSDWGGNNK